MRRRDLILLVSYTEGFNDDNSFVDDNSNPILNAGSRGILLRLYFAFVHVYKASVSPYLHTTTAVTVPCIFSRHCIFRQLSSFKMNTSILCALALCLVLSLLHQSEAGACFTVQRRKCRGNFCWTVYVRICNRRKRSLESQLEATAAPQHAMLPHYDTDMDGVISTKEFENGLSDDVSFEEALQIHIQADTNADGLLSCDEFLDASFPFQFVAERSCS